MIWWGPLWLVAVRFSGGQLCWVLQRCCALATAASVIVGGKVNPLSPLFTVEVIFTVMVNKAGLRATSCGDPFTVD